jgi:hypothetical protein
MPTCHKPQRPAVVVRRCSLNPRTPETTDSLNANSGNNLGTLQAVIAVSLAVFTALLAAPEVRAQTPNLTPPVTTPQPSAKNLHDWRKGMSRVPLPRRGCFTSSYPSSEWREVPCTTPPARPYPPARDRRPDIVGTATMGRPRYGPHIRGRPAVRQSDRRFFTTSTCNGATNPSRWQRVRFRWIGSACVGCATVAD